MKPFPTIVLGIFVVLGLLAVLIFSTYTAITQDAIGKVVVWGSVPQQVFDDALSVVSVDSNAYDGVSYEFKPAESLIPELVAAIAAGRGPDLVLFPASHLLSDGDKLVTIPYASYPRRTFVDTYVEAGEVFLRADGILGIPLTVDPLVMYWNRSLFSAAGVSEPPETWEELTELTPVLSRSDERGTLLQSAVALGTWDNVNHAKAILLTMFRQLGNQVVAESSDGFVTTLDGSSNERGFSGSSALRYYTEFADPVKSAYSWNRSQPSAREAFIGNKLAIYFGRASELFSIRQANPNLNFDVAAVPHVQGGPGAVEAEVIGLSIPRGSRNPDGAFAVAQSLAAPAAEAAFESALNTPSIRRGTLRAAPNDPYSETFRTASLNAFAFNDPDPTASASVFKRMVDGVSSGQVSVSEAVVGAARELQSLLGE